MDSIKKTYPYLQKGLICLYFLICFLSFAYIFLQQMIFIYLMCILLMMLGWVYYLIYKDNQKQIRYLIHNADAIIEQREIGIIDGEGELSLLSHKIYMLYKRYHAMIETMK